MSAYQIKTFKDIYTAVREQLGVQAGDSPALVKIKRAINHIYLNEVVPYEQWKWLRDSIDVVHNAAYSSGTANVTAVSRTVTLTVAPGVSVKGYWFATTGYSERYRIAQHTAGSTTVVLESEYTGETTTTATYKIWKDFVALPSDCRETVTVRHDFRQEPLEGVGLETFRKREQIQPKAQGRPTMYSTGEYIEPIPFDSISGLPLLLSRSSNGYVRTLTFASSVASYLEAGNRIEISSSTADAYNGESIVNSVSSNVITYTLPIPYNESSASDSSLVVKLAGVADDYERFREMLIYPSIFDKKVTLHVDYIKDATPLENDDDEPLMPIQDRSVLVDGALMIVWKTIGRDPEEASQSAQLYDRKMTKMQGKLDDSTDYPILRPGRTYLRAKRSARKVRTRGLWDSGLDSGGSSGTSSVIRNDPNTVAIFNSDGELDASPTISSTELTYLNKAVPSSNVSLSDATTNGTAISYVSADNPYVVIDYYLIRGSAVEAGNLAIYTDGSNVSYSQEVTITDGTPGVTFDAAISGSNVLVRYTTSSSGSGATMTYSYRSL